MAAIPSSRFALFSLLFISSLAVVASSPDSPLTVTVASPIKLTADQGGGAVRTRKLEIRNTGRTKLEWTASATQAWLRFEPPGGSLAPKATATVELVADPTGFSPGIYSASAQISAPQSRPQYFDVTMIEQSAFAGVPIGNADRTFPPDSGMVNVKTEYGAKG